MTAPARTAVKHGSKESVSRTKPEPANRLISSSRSAQGLLIAAVIAGFIAGALFVAQAILLSGVVNRVFRLGQTLDDVLPLLGLLLGLALLRAGLIWAEEVLAQGAASRVKAGLRSQLLARVYALGPAFTRSERSGELVTTAVEGVEALDSYVTQFLPAVLSGRLAAGVGAASRLPFGPLDHAGAALRRADAAPAARLDRRSGQGHHRAPLPGAELDERLLPGRAARHCHAQDVRPQPGAGRHHRGDQPALRQDHHGGAGHGLPDLADDGVGGHRGHGHGRAGSQSASDERRHVLRPGAGRAAVDAGVLPAPAPDGG